MAKHRFVSSDARALAFCSVVLIMHAVFLVPSVVAVPCEPLLESPTQPEVWISGPQDKRNGVCFGTMFQPLSVGVHAQLAANVELVAAAKTQECLAADAGTARSRAVRSEHIGVMKDGTSPSVPMLEAYEGAQQQVSDLQQEVNGLEEQLQTALGTPRSRACTLM